MKITAVHLGRKFQLRDLPSQLGVKERNKDPLVIEYGTEKYVVILKYGVVVYFGFSHGEINEFSSKLSEYVIEKFDRPIEDEVRIIVSQPRNLITGNEIHVRELTIDYISVVALIIGRSVALDHYDKEVDLVLHDFEAMMKSFAESGTTNLSPRRLLKKVGFAMNTQHAIVAQMALLDKPELTWNDAMLDSFYNELLRAYEIEDRYEVLEKKLSTIFNNVKFTLNYIHSKRANFLEMIVIALFIIDILVLFIEKL